MIPIICRTFQPRNAVTEDCRNTSTDCALPSMSPFHIALCR